MLKQQYFIFIFCILSSLSAQVIIRNPYDLSSHSINELGDVEALNPDDSSSLIYDGNNKVWIAGKITGGSSSSSHDNPFNWLCGSSFEPDIYDSVLDCDWKFINTSSDTSESLIVNNITENAYLDTIGRYSGIFALTLKPNVKIWQKVEHLWYDSLQNWTLSFYSTNTDSLTAIISFEANAETLICSSDGLNFITEKPSNTGYCITIEFINNSGGNNIYIDDVSLTKTSSWIYFAPKPCSDQIWR